MLIPRLALLRAALVWWREQYWGDDDDYDGPWISDDPPCRLPRKNATVLLDGKDYPLGEALRALRRRVGGRRVPEWMQEPLDVMDMPWRAAAPRRAAQRRGPRAAVAGGGYPGGGAPDPPARYSPHEAQTSPRPTRA